MLVDVDKQAGSERIHETNIWFGAASGTNMGNDKAGTKFDGDF